MKKIFRFFIASNHKRRCLLVGVVLWLLRLLHDVEDDEVRRNSDLLDNFDPEINGFSRSKYIALEEEYLTGEYALSVLESAIEELGYAY